MFDEVMKLWNLAANYFSWAYAKAARSSLFTERVLGTVCLATQTFHHFQVLFDR